MKKIGMALCVIFFTLSANAQEGITGVWLNAEKDGKIKVYQKGDEYFGKIIWIKNNTNENGSSPKLDVKNPDPAQRTQPVEGTIILKNLVWDADDNEWDDGEIYDPKSGNTYSVYANLKSENVLYLKGYIGISLLGRSTEWTRVNP